jgi:hypothetical protein
MLPSLSSSKSIIGHLTRPNYPGAGNDKMTERQTLVALVISEFLKAALFASVAGNIALARMHGRPVRLIAPPSAYMPGTPTVFHGAIQRMVMLGVPAKILRCMHDFYMRTEFAKQISMSAFASTDVTTQDLVAINDAWMAACGTALINTYFLAEEDGLPSEEHAREVAVFHDAVSRLRNSETVFIRTDGAVVIPGWIDFRRDHRRSVGWRISIQNDGQFGFGTLDNISRSGMGISTTLQLDPSNVICVVLPNSRLLHGVVAWSNGERHGIELSELLSEDDPLFD